MKQLRELIAKEKATQIISVGDVVTRNMMQHRIPVHIMIVDNKAMREQVEPVRVTAEKTVNLKNPPGTLSPESWTTLEEVIRGKAQTRLLVDGEEDLLTLVAILNAPQNAFVIYGQPHEGIVVVKVDEGVKEKVRRIVDSMEPVSKS